MKARARQALGAVGLGPQYDIWRRHQRMRTMRPAQALPEIHDSRVQVAERRCWALHHLSGTPDGARPGEVAAFFGAFSVVDPGVPLTRVGGKGDGGYLVPDDLSGVVACLSPGVAETASFEEDMIGRGIPCHLIDASVAKAPLTSSLITFRPLFLGPESKPGWITLDDWIAEVAPDGGSDLLLQMDIEGAEWEVLARTTSDSLRRFRILVVELHDLHLMGLRQGMALYRHVFERLLEAFVLVHVHENNNEFPVECDGFDVHPVVETTWLRRDRLRESSGATSSLRHPLDQSCGDDLPDLPLDPRWA